MVVVQNPFGGRDPAFAAAARGGLGLGFQRHPARHAVKPAGKRMLLANSSELTGKEQKRRLEGVLGILGVLQGPPTDAVHHRPVPTHERFKRGLVALVEETPDQLAVALVGQGLSSHSLREAAEKIAHVRWGHVANPQRVVSVTPESSSCQRRVVPNYFANQQLDRMARVTPSI